MMLKNLVRSCALSMAFAAGSLAVTTVNAETKPTHHVIKPAQAPSVSGKIDVIEFFAYTCPHCYNMESLTESWAQNLPEDVVFSRVPVAFNASGTDLQRLYYTLEALGRLDLHTKVFQALHKERKRITSSKAISSWAEDQGLDRKEFEAAFSSFGVSHKVNRAKEMTESYQVNATPSIAVNGAYITSPGMTGNYANTILEAQRLLDSALSEKP